MNEVGVLMEQSLVGEAYVKNFRKACQQARHPHRGRGPPSPRPLRTSARQVQRAVRRQGPGRSCTAGFGFGVVFVNSCSGRSLTGTHPVCGHRIRERVDQRG